MQLGERRSRPIFRRRRCRLRGHRRLSAGFNSLLQLDRFLHRRQSRLWLWRGQRLGHDWKLLCQHHSAIIPGGRPVGANWEFGPGIVIGAEADFDWLPNSSNATTITAPAALGGTTATTTINDRWLTLVDARVGYAWDRLLVYGKGGWAFAGVSNSNVTVTGTGYGNNGSGSNNGWTAGAGLEYAVWGTWSVRAEYDFVRLNNATLTVSPVAPKPFGAATSSQATTDRSRCLRLG